MPNLAEGITASTRYARDSEMNRNGVRGAKAPRTPCSRSSQSEACDDLLAGHGLGQVRVLLGSAEDDHVARKGDEIGDPRPAGLDPEVRNADLGKADGLRPGRLATVVEYDGQPGADAVRDGQRGNAALGLDRASGREPARGARERARGQAVLVFNEDRRQLRDSGAGCGIDARQGFDGAGAPSGRRRVGGGSEARLASDSSVSEKHERSFRTE